METALGSSGFHSALLGLTGSTVAVGALWDAYRYRIPNALTLMAMLAGLAYHAGLGPDARGFLFSLGGLFPLLGIGFLLFSQGWLGAGDAKLLGAVGALIGFDAGLSAFIYATACGGAWVVLWVTVKSRGMVWFGGLEGLRGQRVPYGFAIAAGTALALAHPLLGA